LRGRIVGGYIRGKEDVIVMGWVEDKALDRVGEFAWVSFVRFVVVDVVYAERDWKAGS
jgi:hypothetical protein